MAPEVLSKGTVYNLLANWFSFEFMLYIPLLYIVFMIADLMNGGDLHYHLSQHGVFNEADMKFYAAEVILGLEHMHKRFIVYRDLKLTNTLLEDVGCLEVDDEGLLQGLQTQSHLGSSDLYVGLIKHTML